MHNSAPEHGQNTTLHDLIRKADTELNDETDQRKIRDLKTLLRFYRANLRKSSATV